MDVDDNIDDHQLVLTDHGTWGKALKLSYWGDAITTDTEPQIGGQMVGRIVDERNLEKSMSWIVGEGSAN
jgi:hypothetical protein